MKYDIDHTDQVVNYRRRFVNSFIFKRSYWIMRLDRGDHQILGRESAI